MAKTVNGCLSDPSILATLEQAERPGAWHRTGRVFLEVEDSMTKDTGCGENRDKTDYHSHMITTDSLLSHHQTHHWADANMKKLFSKRRSEIELGVQLRARVPTDGQDISYHNTVTTDNVMPAEPYVPPNNRHQSSDQGHIGSPALSQPSYNCNGHNINYSNRDQNVNTGDGPMNIYNGPGVCLDPFTPQIPAHSDLSFSGSAGAGKSAIAQTIAERSHPTLSDIILQVVNNSPSLLHMTLEAQFRGLVVEPLLKWRKDTHSTITGHY
ncbi:hypothetical protein L218DRAFT_948635 [Marasmius fiardii PR-910]|nr:hypothetical protein L218DRAFT_948635 [Marasmius fiardii PR-910]